MEGDVPSVLLERFAQQVGTSHRRVGPQEIGGIRRRGYLFESERLYRVPAIGLAEEEARQRKADPLRAGKSTQFVPRLLAFGCKGLRPVIRIGRGRERVAAHQARAD